MLFDTGQIVMTPGAHALLSDNPEQGSYLLARHMVGDWGDDLCMEDVESNDAAVFNEGRIVSSYTVGTDKVWVITEWDRSVTTFLLPDEY